MHNLTLRRVDDGSSLEGLPKDLVRRAFPDALPPLITSGRHYHYTPQEECLSLPSDVISTTFRLLVSYDGWEYAVYERPLRGSSGSGSVPVGAVRSVAQQLAAGAAPGEEADEDKAMLVTVVEFESTAMVIGHLGIRIQLVAYPVISIKKSFLDDIDFRLRTDPNFKGLL